MAYRRFCWNYTSWLLTSVEGCSFLEPESGSLDAQGDCVTKDLVSKSTTSPGAVDSPTPVSFMYVAFSFGRWTWTRHAIVDHLCHSSDVFR